MEGKYTFEQFEEDLNKGHQIYLTFVNNRYLVYKTNENCFTQELVNYEEKNPQPRMLMITYKRLKELFAYSTDLEIKVKF